MIVSFSHRDNLASHLLFIRSEGLGSHGRICPRGSAIGSDALGFHSSDLKQQLSAITGSAIRSDGLASRLPFIRSEALGGINSSLQLSAVISSLSGGVTSSPGGITSSLWQRPSSGTPSSSPTEALECAVTVVYNLSQQFFLQIGIADQFFPRIGIHQLRRRRCPPSALSSPVPPSAF